MSLLKTIPFCLLLMLASCSLPAETPPLTNTPQPACTPPPCDENQNLICPDGDCPGGCGTVCASAANGASDWWQPPLDTRFHIQYDGEINLDLDVDMYNLDLFETTPEMISHLHARGVQVVCYFSAGSFEDWRPDAGQFHEEVIGEPLADWEGEAWLDIRSLELLEPIMTARLDMAADKGCDGVDPDNVNGYMQDSGFPLTAEDQLSYNRWLAEEAHARGLAIGLKNDLEQIPALAGTFDFAVNEECFDYYECELLLPFVQQGKPVFGIEYHGAPEEFCPQANQLGFQTVLKNLALDEFQVACWDGN